MRGSQLLNLLSEVSDHLGKPHSLCGRDPIKIEPIFLKPRESQKILQYGHTLDGHIVSFDIMAIPDVAASHQHSIRSFLKGLQDMVRRNRGRTHDADRPGIGRVLQPTDSGQIRTTVTAPVAQESNDLGIETTSTLHFLCHTISPSSS